MSRTRVYIKPFDLSGEYVSDFIEVTHDVLKLGEIKQNLDNTEYDVGVFRNSNFKIALRNDHGRYSETNSLRSVFKTKRVDTQVKVTWDWKDYDLASGFFNPDEELSDQELSAQELTVFEGLLTDVSSVSNITEQEVSFNVLGFESLLDRAELSYSLISNNDNISHTIYNSLNQEVITSLLRVSASNISVGLDTAIDDKSDLENKTLKEALSDLLLLSNSVLYIKERTIYVKNRQANPRLSHTFYGPASIRGVENIIDIKNYREGNNRVRNYWTWKGTSTKSADSSSINKYGVQKQEIDSALLNKTSTTKASRILDSLRDEFKTPKTEMTLEAPLTYNTLSLFLLDKIKIDFPTVVFPADENPIPRYGQNLYGNSHYPYGQWSLTIPLSHNFKIMGVSTKPTEDLVTFKLRRV